MKQDEDREDELLRSVALQNASAILLARQRAEKELTEAREALRVSAERLQLALSAGDLGAWSWEASTDLLSLSDRAAEIFGLPRRTPVTWTRMRELLHGEDRERARLAVERSAATRTDYDIEYRLIRPSGARCWVAAKGRPTYGPHGTLTGMTGVVQDITERRDAEEALREETRVLELLNRTGVTLAANLDLHTLVQAVTDAATQLSGAQFGAFFYNTTDNSGDALLLYTLSGAPPDAFEKFGQPRATALFGPTFRGEPPIRSDDILKDPRYGKSSPHHGMPAGHLPVRSYLSVPVISRSGEVIGGLFFGHPEPRVFSERDERLMVGIAAQAAIAIDNARLFEASRKAAQERAELLESERLARTEAERASAMKDEFLATLSHELRTPLSAILGWAQVLRRGARNQADLMQGLETIERNARIQTQLIEDLLDMSRITSGKMRLEIQSVEPVPFIEAALETVRPAAEAKGVKLEKILDPAAGPIAGDASRLQQVVWNLLSNAIKFTPKGGKVQVVLERVNSHIEISVADTGVGIPAQFLPHVFERFRQADASTTRNFGGLGLGLSIVKTLVEMHGGSATVKSPGEGRGTTFSVLLPVSAVHRNLDTAPRLHPSAPRPLATDFDFPDLTGVRVLVVDDEPDARGLIERVLTDCHAEVLTARSALDALEMLRSRSVDVLVSDIGMPGTDGYAFLKQVRALPEGKGRTVPAIALTAFARSEDRTRALRAGFLVHVSKPVEPSELVATVAALAGRIGANAED